MSNSKVFQFSKWICKCIIAGIIAIALLSIIFIPYSTLPVHISNEKGNTDYVWPANSVWMTMREGISHGRFDEWGYNNKAAINNPDIIIVGSSHRRLSR